MSRKAAIVTVVTAAALDISGGLLFAVVEHVPLTSGLYWAVATATTVGYGDVTPHDGVGRAVAVVVMLTVIPLFGATFSLFTAGITTTGVREHVHDAEKRIKEHTEERLRHHLGKGLIADGQAAQAPDAARTARQRGQGQVPAGPCE